MKISTKAYYGLKAMLELGLRYGQGPVQLREVAGSQSLPLDYLEQVMIPLRRAGLVRGARGVGGGSYLARPPQEISLAEVVLALEGPISLPNNGDRPDACRQVWEELEQAILAALSSRTLADLCGGQRELEERGTLTYNI